MDNNEIYAAPATDPSIKRHKLSASRGILRDLGQQSTLLLLLFTVITLGIYLAHYIRRQTKILNQVLSPTSRISMVFVNSILILSYLTVALIFPYFFLEISTDLESAIDVIDRILSILTIVWAFKARNRMNTLLKAQPGDGKWFHGLWTFLFNGLYFNYRVNTLKQLIPNITSKDSITQVKSPI